MKKIFLFLWLVTNLNTLLSSDIKLKLVGEDEYLRRGKISKVVLTSNNAELIQSLKKNNKNISLNQWLYLYSVEFIQEEKKDMVSIGATVVLKELPTTTDIEITLAEKKYMLSFEEVKFNPEDASLKPQGSIFNEVYNFQRFWLWLTNNIKALIFFTLAFLVGLILAIFKIKRRIMVAKNIKQLKNDWLKKLQEATTRQEIEKLYHARAQWQKFYSNSSIDDLLTYINSIQYSPEWSIEQQDLVLQKLEKMKQSLI